MKGETKSAGFTIVEALIVLAVTSALFVSVMVVLGGKQNKAQFQQAARDIQTKLQQTINQVATGYYPNAGDFSCHLGTDAGGSKVPAFLGVPVGQGSSEDCMFIGKVIQFSVNSSTPEQYNTYSIAALRSATSNTDTQAVVIEPPVGKQPVTQNDFLTYGLTTKYMCYSTGTNCLASPVSNPINAVGFISDVGSLDSGKTYEAGALNLVALTGLGLGANESVTVNKINQSHLQPPQTVVNPSGGVLICFQSGSTNDTAVLSIGSNGHNMAVKLEVKAC